MQQNLESNFSHEKSNKLFKTIVEKSTNSGLMMSANFYCISKFFVNLLLLGVILLFTWTAGNIWIIILASFPISFIVSQFAFLGHDALHHAVGKNQSLNKILGYWSHTVISGLAFKEWAGRHLTHHQNCQIDGQDPDMDVEMVASLTKRTFKQKAGFWRWVGKFQGYYIWSLSLLFGHSQRLISQYNAIKNPIKYKFDLIHLILHYLLWWGLPIFILEISVLNTTLVYFLPATIIGVHLASVFWVNHVGMPLVEDLKTHSRLSHQILTSRNIQTSPKWDIYFGGLNFQIEHHILPSVPSFKLRRLQKIVKPLILESKLKYNSDTWGNVVLKIQKHLKEVSRS